MIKYVPGEGFGQHSPEVADAISAVESAASGGQRQGFRIPAAARKAIEDHGMKRAIQYFKRQGWTVTDVHNRRHPPFDLLCTKGSTELLHVEVKGTTSDGSEVLLTTKEANDARQRFPKTALYVLANVQLVGKGGQYVASGGRHRLYHPWDIRRGRLTAVGFSHQPK